MLLPVNDDLYATLTIGSEAFPFEIFHDDLNNFYQGFVNWHKQKTIWLELCTKIFSADKAPKEHPQDVRILQMLEYLRKHYDRKFSLSDMADTFHISRGECCRFFKKMMGMTISEYLLEYRLTKSMELLNSTSLSITEIAHAVGFISSSNYSALFKEKTGYSPREYRGKKKM